MLQRRNQPMIEALAEQRRREDEAPRLRDQIVALRSLRFEFDEIRVDGRLAAASYGRPIVVATAPAYFEIRCMEPRCDGRHDLTPPVLRALNEARVAFAGESACSGMVRDVPCDRTLAYRCQATYGNPHAS